MGQSLSSARAAQAQVTKPQEIAEDLRTIWFVGFGDSLGGEAFNHLRMLGVEPVTLHSIADLRLATSRSSDRIIVAVVNVDSFGNLYNWFDVILQLRNAIPELVLVITSKDFRHEDLSCERLPICDASIRNPFSEVRLSAAISAGISNNSEWQRRVLTAKRVRMAALMEKQRSMEPDFSGHAATQDVNRASILGSGQST